MITRVTTIEITEVQEREDYFVPDWERKIKSEFPYDWDSIIVAKVQDFETEEAEDIIRGFEDALSDAREFCEFDIIKEQVDRLRDFFERHSYAVD